MKSIKKPTIEGTAKTALNFVSGPQAPVTRVAAKKDSGFIPDGDVRLTANIRQDLHLKLKIAAANERTTIGEIIENLIIKHLANER